MINYVQLGMNYVQPRLVVVQFPPWKIALSNNVTFMDICEPEIRKYAGNQWSVTKNQFLISLGKYVYSERRDLHLSENIYFPTLIRKWFLVMLH